MEQFFGTTLWNNSIIDFVSQSYGVRYAPNTRETIRDEAVKYFVEAGMLIRNPDNPSRPTNSAKTVYQVEPQALELLRSYKTPQWSRNLKAYLVSRELILRELGRARSLTRIPVKLPSGRVLLCRPAVKTL